MEQNTDVPSFWHKAAVWVGLVVGLWTLVGYMTWFLYTDVFVYLLGD
jgi:hypothetical protein